MSPTAGSSCRIEVLDPMTFAEPANLIIRESFKAPCLLYTPDYLRWLFSFTNGLNSIGVIAFEGDEPVGFFAVMPRRMRVGDRPILVYLLSCLAIRPAWRGPVSSDMYEAMLGVIRDVGEPFVIYVRPDSVAERKLLWNFGRAGFQSRSLGSFRTYGAADAADSAGSTTRVEEGDEESYLEVAWSCRNERVLWRIVGREEYLHYGADPRGCALAVIRDAAGRPIGAATVHPSQVVVPNGIESVATIDSVFLPQPTAEALAGLVRFARRRWGAMGTSPVVTAPNLQWIDPAIVRAAGLRAMPSLFRGYLLTPATGALPEVIAGTNLEVV